MPTDLKQRALEEEEARETAAARLQGDLKMAVGFRRVIDELSKAGKPVLTHNGMLVRFLCVFGYGSLFLWLFVSSRQGVLCGAVSSLYLLPMERYSH